MEWLILLDLVLITAYFVSIESVDGSVFGTVLFVLPYIFLIVYLTAKCIRSVDNCALYFVNLKIRAEKKFEAFMIISKLCQKLALEKSIINF